MNKELIAIQKIKKGGLLPLFYQDDEQICLKVVETLYEAGIRTLEFTNRGPRAFLNFKELIKEKIRSMPDLLLGVGTIKNGIEAKSFIEFGADFLVSPFLDEDIAKVSSQYNMLWIPGCMTPTEIHKSQNLGCHLIKIFPGNILGTGYLDAIMPIFPGLSFLITGGVDTSEPNIRAWFKSGASGVALGSKLITPDVLLKKDYDGLNSNTTRLLGWIQEIKKEGPYTQ